jgi:Cu-processing system permease protein
MRAVLTIAADILREAAARRWFLAFAAVLTLLHLGVLLGLRLELVDGALAATRLFGGELSHDIRAADSVLRHVFEAATYIAFYGGLGFGVLACSDFGPELLAPGRIEHLLSLPLRRVELLAGTFLGVMTLCLLGISYGVGGFFLILCAKSGVWTLRPFLAVYLAGVAFFALYAVMLATAVFVRSAALSAAAGGLLFVLGMLAGRRDELGALFESGWGRELFLGLSAPLPRVYELGQSAAAIAVGDAAPAELWRWVAGTVVFGLAGLAVGAWRLSSKDF